MRHAINSYMPGEPERIKRFKTRITSPVHPGTTLRTELWQVAPGELRFVWLMRTQQKLVRNHILTGELSNLSNPFVLGEDKRAYRER